ncbi:MAG: hypothetical protein KKD30_14730 [Gammaproteobacteria bacterium]|nr:hypothetical protein [Gammaproteobacteria bacterium]MBU0884057.1 hypothetical protein [Gammaproteobacteria bacterium]MBU1861201.1 hypothetical protein [Gammaproteobacteria bacterium]
MSAVRSFLGAAWSYGVYLPLYVMWRVVTGFVRAAFDFLYPRGYKPCNELADAFVGECANRPVRQSVRLPWVDNSAMHSLVMNNTGRLLSYVAIASGCFGVAVKDSGTKYQPERTYRYYYRRSMTGNWFAEIWSVWKSGLLSAVLALPCVDFAVDVAEGRAVAGHYGAMLLVSGALLVICFLPRAFLGRGVHFPAISLVNGAALGGYGCAQTINWFAGLAGVSYLWLAAGLEWDFGAAFEFAASKAGGFISSSVEWAKIDGWMYTVFMTPVIIAAAALLGLAWTVIPAAFFWYVSLRFIAARNAKAQLEALPLNAIHAAMYAGSDFQVAAELRAPQIFLGFLVYIVVLLGIILYPISASIAG